MLRINYNPRLTLTVARQGWLADRPLVVLDVGSRGGAHPIWEHFGDHVQVVGFDVDQAEVDALNSANPKHRHIAAALGAAREQRQLYLPRFRAAGSFYRLDGFFAGVDNHRNVTIETVETVTTTPLSDVASEHGIQYVDFMKLDVEGAELDVLKGAGDMLGTMLGVEAEVHFQDKVLGSPRFAELDEFLTRQRFELFDLDTFRFARSVMPKPPLYDFRDEDGTPLPGPTVEGQVLTGDALYFRDLAAPGAHLTATEVLKLACLFEIHRLPDCAAELLLTHEPTLAGRVPDPRALLDLLTPEVDGGYLSFEDYLVYADRFRAHDERLFGPNYHLLEDLWRRRNELDGAAAREPFPEAPTLTVRGALRRTITRRLRSR